MAEGQVRTQAELRKTGALQPGGAAVRIAIVRLSSLGDIIFCMASLQLIRRHLPGAAITWVADSKFADVLDHHPDLEAVIKLDLKRLKKNLSWEAIRAEYRKLTAAGGFDLVIDLHGMLKSSLVAARLGRQRAGFHWLVAKEPLATLWYQQSHNLPLEMNTVCRYASLTARALGFSFQEGELIDKEPYLFFAETDRQLTSRYFSAEKKNVIFVVGSTWESRNYPKEHFVTIANALGENILICAGSDQEFATARFIAERSPHVTVLPRMDLNQLKAAISSADLVIGGDTGPTHMAWANNVPAIVIFGPTPAHRIYPNRACRIFKSSSPVNERRLDRNDFSIREIAADEVLLAARELLANPLRR